MRIDGPFVGAGALHQSALLEPHITAVAARSALRLMVTQPQTRPALRPNGVFFCVRRIPRLGFEAIPTRLVPACRTAVATRASSCRASQARARPSRPSCCCARSRVLSCRVHCCHGRSLRRCKPMGATFFAAYVKFCTPSMLARISPQPFRTYSNTRDRSHVRRARARACTE